MTISREEFDAVRRLAVALEAALQEVACRVNETTADSEVRLKVSDAMFVAHRFALAAVEARGAQGEGNGRSSLVPDAGGVEPVAGNPAEAAPASAPPIPQALTNALLDLQDARKEANNMSRTGNRMAALRRMNAAILQVLNAAEALRAAADAVAETPHVEARGENGVASRGGESAKVQASVPATGASNEVPHGITSPSPAPSPVAKKKCNAGNPEGYLCTREYGHTGMHEASTAYDPVYRRWFDAPSPGGLYPPRCMKHNAVTPCARCDAHEAGQQAARESFDAVMSPPSPVEPLSAVIASVAYACGLAHQKDRQDTLTGSNIVAKVERLLAVAKAVEDEEMLARAMCDGELGPGSFDDAPQPERNIWHARAYSVQAAVRGSEP